LIGALGLGAVTLPANATPLAPNPAATRESNIVQVWGGCGWGFRPVPGHWSQWRGWVPPHCVPNRRWGPYAAGHPYWGQYRYW
jgi:hypothetical protein